MRIFWNDQGRGIESNAAKSVDLKEALSIWSDELLGVKGNFLGLVDDQDRTIQFYFDQGIPDDVDDATHLRIVHLDFPRPELKGSYEADVTIGEVQGLIRKAFREGADYQRFEKLKFSKW